MGKGIKREESEKRHGTSTNFRFMGEMILNLKKRFGKTKVDNLEIFGIIEY